MIVTFQKQFIRIAMSAMSLCIILILIAINLLNYFAIRDELEGTLYLISRNTGGFPPYTERDKRNDRLMRDIPESEYMTRYFYVSYHEDGSVNHINVNHISAVKRLKAKDFAEQARAYEKEYGFIGSYMYYVRTSKTGEIFVFGLDCQTKLGTIKTLAILSATVGVAGLALAFLIVLLLSKKAMQPVLVGEEKQKRFITDASHELKTPLSVISANMAVLGMDLGENEWVENTQAQVHNMRRLVDGLISLARLDEEAELGAVSSFSLSDAIIDSAAPFAAIAAAQSIPFQRNIAEGISFTGNEALLRQLVGILCDNAVKYVADKGKIRMDLLVKKQTILLSISNTCALPTDTLDLNRLFDRFYRADASRTKPATGDGFGIGLSIAKRIAEQHKGDIHADSPSPDMIRFTVTLPK